MTKVFDRRQKKRIPYSGTICLLPVNQEKTVMADIMDLSASGLRVRSSDSIKVNSEILCDIPIEKDRMALKGRIVWCDKGDHLDAGMGIEFIDLSTNDEARLAHLVNARVRKHNSVKVWFEGMKTPVLAEAESIPDGIRLYTSLPFLRLNSPVGFKFYYDRCGKPVRGNVKRVTLNSSSTDPVPRLLIDLDPDQVVDLSGLLAMQPETTELPNRDVETQMLFENADHDAPPAAMSFDPSTQNDRNPSHAFSDVTPVQSFELNAATRAGQISGDPTSVSSARVATGVFHRATAHTSSVAPVRSGEIDSNRKRHTRSFTAAPLGQDPHAAVEIQNSDLTRKASSIERSFDEDAKTLEGAGALRTRIDKLTGSESAEELEAILGFTEDDNEMRRLNTRKQRFLWLAALGLFGFGLYMALNSGVFRGSRTAPITDRSQIQRQNPVVHGMVTGSQGKNIDVLAANAQQQALENEIASPVAVVEERSWNRDDHDIADKKGPNIAINESKSGTVAREIARDEKKKISSAKTLTKAPTSTSGAVPSSVMTAPVLRQHDGKLVASVPIAGSLAGAHHYPLADPRGVVVMLPKAKATIPYKDYRNVGDKFRTIWVRRRETGGVQLRFIFSEPGQRYSVDMVGDHISVAAQ